MSELRKRIADYLTKAFMGIPKDFPEDECNHEADYTLSLLRAEIEKCGMTDEEFKALMLLWGWDFDKYWAKSQYRNLFLKIAQAQLQKILKVME